MRNLHLHGVDSKGRQIVRKKLKRSEVKNVIMGLPPETVIALKRVADHITGAGFSFGSATIRNLFTRSSPTKRLSRSRNHDARVVWALLAKRQDYDRYKAA